VAAAAGPGHVSWAERASISATWSSVSLSWAAWMFSATRSGRRLPGTLGEELAAGGLGYSPLSFADVAADWLESLDELVAAGRRFPRTVAFYRHALTRHVLPRARLQSQELSWNAPGERTRKKLAIWPNGDSILPVGRQLKTDLRSLNCN
jgi:hypothetical protein